ncbi:MAG: tetratricopeptide repeat protein [Rhodospirillaceae bacterium]|nr:tetratricopeptide repeat protein [Rhodospirillaceae bacterium]MBT5940235.1 tetratricopeptide repeat protein [Rhodospirillaceae bacterium]MBT7267276.1 tetratricopeptide repeat protein [Rhodospirillaceae bacterium]
MQNNLSDGFVHLNNGDLTSARAAFQMALNFDANDVGALSGMAAVLHGEQDFTGALGNSEAALKLDPRNAELHVHHAQYLLSAGRGDEAKSYLSKAARFGADAPDTLYNLGVLYSMMGEFREAKKNLLKASKLNKDDPQTLMTLGSVCTELGDFTQAVKSLTRCQELVPGSPEVSHQLGNLYFQQGDFDNALKSLKHCLAIDAANSDAYLSLSAVYFKIGQIDPAIEACERALQLDPSDASTHYNIAKYYGLRKNLEKALVHSKQAFELNPADSDAAATYYQFRRQACDWQDLETLSAQLDAFLSDQALEPTSELPFINVFRSADSATNLRVAQARSAKISAGISGDGFLKRIERRREKKNAPPINIGYVSSDFRDHPTGHLMQHFFGLHDRSKFRIHAYSHGPNDASPYRQTIEGECGSFTDISGLDDFEAAKRINNDNIDILVDLNVHITGERMGICAHRPAPVQINMLAYPGTSGASYYDFIVTDQINTPLEDEDFFSEKFLILPDTYFITDAKSEISDRIFSRAECGLPATLKDGAVFACFNNSYKIEPQIFASWLNILEKSPGSVLWLFANNELCQTNLRRLTTERGIGENRLVFAEDLPKPDHLARLAIADLALDTGIYGGHTTTADALLVGVPTATQLGSHFASRASSSILNALGMSELICPDIEAYEELALKLSSDGAELQRLKAKIEENKVSHPLFDGVTYMCHFEAGLEAAYQMWLENREFNHITVEI